MNERTPTANAARKCAEWLKSCKAIGWTADETSMLCDLWWQYHDDNGNLVSSPSTSDCGKT